MHTDLPKLSESRARMLEAYDWPGNVRELQNATERALISAQNGLLVYDIPGAASSRGSNGLDVVPGRVLTEAEMKTLERENYLAALWQCRWKVHGLDGAACLLQIKPTTLILRG